LKLFIDFTFLYSTKKDEYVNKDKQKYIDLYSKKKVPNRYTKVNIEKNRNTCRIKNTMRGVMSAL